MIPTHRLSLALACATLLPSVALSAQTASFVYKLGKDTVGVEQFTRTANRLSGDVVSRSGATVVRVEYDVALGADGKATAVSYKLFGADGKPMRGRPTEIRYTMKGDSATRVVVWPDSTPTRTFAAPGAVPFAAPAYGMLELAFQSMRRGNTTTATFPVLGVGVGATLPMMAFTAAGGDTIRQPSGIVYLVDRQGRMQTFDGSSTTSKLVGSRGTGGLDLKALASRMTPIGVLSARGMARGHFQTTAPGGVIMVDYGRPLVRDRSVWGGLLIPLDTIWRLGANEATHFATSRDLAFGDVNVPAGLYTLFLYNAKSGPLLVVNKQVGQWGTVYDQSKDLARIPLTMAASPEHVEEFTIMLRQSAPSRGALEISWGAQTATAAFIVK